MSMYFQKKLRRKLKTMKNDTVYKGLKITEEQFKWFNSFCRHQCLEKPLHVNGFRRLQQIADEEFMDILVEPVPEMLTDMIKRHQKEINKRMSELFDKEVLR